MKTTKDNGDAMIRISLDTRAKLKMQALKLGLTLKEYLKQIAEGKQLIK